MTTLLTDIRRFDPFFVGFDRLFDRLASFDAKETLRPTTYPPYNIVKKDEYKYEIELAVAGISAKDINIEHNPETSVLTVEGSKGGTEDNYLHKGIAERNFVRTWTLADNVEVTGADLNDGLLKVELERIVPEEKRPKTIKIGTRKVSKSEKQLLTEE
jgi:molecular chaperone IbpA